MTCTGFFLDFAQELDDVFDGHADLFVGIGVFATIALIQAVLIPGTT